MLGDGCRYCQPQTYIERLLEALEDARAAPVSVAKAQGVVMPEPMKRGDEGGSGEYGAAMIRGYNACLREVARLNAAPVRQPKCKTCNDNGRIGGPSFYAPDEGGEPCPDCSTPVQQVSVPDEMRSLAQRLREYNQNPHHINPMSEAFHILVADAANALSAACVPKEIAAAITWSEHLLFECGALTSTRAPSVHVYNKTFAAVNEARAMLNATPAAPAADAWMVEALDYQVLFDAIAAATSVYANGAINISVQVFRDALAAHRAKGVV